MDIHETYMHRCLELAELGSGQVAPNPMVGALLVHDGMIISEGYHERYGEAHAEVNCINNVPGHQKHLIKESILYVSLEPCTHFGRTPPCVDLIIRSRIPSVVIGCKDSFEKVNGTGIERLKEAGIEVTVGIMEKESLELNKRFFTFQKEQRPYIILKWAQSHDLKIANADQTSVKISNELTNRLVHKWRSEEAAIMVGTRTAIQDDPILSSRLVQGNDPVRIVIDKFLKIPSTHHLLDNSIPTIIINTIRQAEEGNTTYYKTGASENMIAVTLSILRQRNLISLLVEGGTILLQSLIDSGMWDEARIITNQKLFLGSGINAPVVNSIPKKKEIIRDDEIIYYSQKNSVTL
ncbi:MAG: bifunctional diaminohydroxyphosphoribosylaminopyrimidine deaminase/5-amino-6-(5-phosphoribosylamino)uracil reductase RibD [Ferruginibacter sp.]